MSKLIESSERLSARKYITFALLLPCIYWIYLFFVTVPEILVDSVQYQSLGALLFEEGWTAYFEGGPSREPGYPLTIALSMFLESQSSIPYWYFQKLIQILSLLSTQCLLYVCMSKMGLRVQVKALVLLYVGFSPAFVNSAFSMFSEIVTYPLVLSVMLLSTMALIRVYSQSVWKMVAIGVGLGAVFVMLISTKAIFEYIFILFCLAWFLISATFLALRQGRTGTNMLIMLLISVFLVQLFVHSFKSLNEAHNGNYTFTNRGAWMLYGGVDKRLAPFSKTAVYAATLTITGSGLCPKILPPADCQHWHFRTSDKLGLNKRKELLKKGISVDEVDDHMISLSIDRIVDQPLQYSLFHILESFRMFFWETTQLGYVQYPSWMDSLFGNPIIKYGVRLASGVLSFIAMVFCTGFLVRNRRDFQSSSDERAFRLNMTLVILSFCTAFMLLYGFFSILTRYTLPIAPLYLLLIAASIDGLLDRKFGT